jgi:GT2 family glycosyltransferase
MNQTLITVLIVTWNRREDVLETIRSLYEQTYKNFEIIVVDNGSVDSTATAIRKAYPAVIIVELDRNTGVSAGRNAGIVVAKGEIILCLDSDASPANETISNIVCKFKSEPQIGVINSKIVDAHTRRIGSAGWVYSAYDLADQDSEFLSYSFSEGGAAIRREVFDKVGLFWERLFFGYEGFEFSLRVLDAGYQILYYPDSLVLHRATARSRIGGGERDKILFTGCLLIYILRFPLWLIAIFLPLKTGATFLRAARRGYFVQILLGWRDFLLQMPSVIKERKPIRNETASHYLKLQRQHGSLRWNLTSWFKHKS